LWLFLGGLLKSLKNHFEELLLDTAKWRYYDELEKKNIEEILKKPKDFITSYLKAAGKLPPEEINTIIENINYERLQHTVSIFFLGLIFYNKSNKIKSEIDKYLEVTKKEIKSEKFNVNHNFIYWWFLTCFIHDIGYAYKKNQKLKLFGTKENYKIESKVFEELKKITEFVNNSVPIQIVNNWEKYSYFRKEKPNNRINHGFLAGAYFIYMLNNIYNNNKQFRNEEAFIDDSKLFWSQKMLDKVHKPIAWIIVAHNVWYKNRNYGNVEEYEKANLENLIIDEPIVKLDKYPLYFLLCLVDSIDPVKYMNEKNETNILSILNNTILLIKKNGNIKIKFINDLQKYNIEYKDILFSLAEWLDLEFEIII